MPQLVKWLDSIGSDNWMIGAHIEQYQVNNCPMRVRGNISLYTIYFGRPNTASYSALLGKSYKVGHTEYGLCLAKHMLEQAKKMDPSAVLSQEQIEKVI
jgi:hypothetical protein